MTSFYITTHDKIHEYYSVFWLRLESAQAPNYPFFRDMTGLWFNFMEKGSRFYPHTYSNLLFNNNHWTIDMYDQRWQEAKTWEIMGAWHLFPNLCTKIFFFEDQKFHLILGTKILRNNMSRKNSLFWIFFLKTPTCKTCKTLQDPQPPHPLLQISVNFLDTSQISFNFWECLQS